MTVQRRIDSRLGFGGVQLLVLAVLVVSVLGASCGKREASTSGGAQTPEQAAADPFNLTGLRAAFANASPGLQVIVDEAIGSIRARDYASALRQFEGIAQRKDLTKEQKKAVEELIAKLRGAGAGAMPR